MKKKKISLKTNLQKKNSPKSTLFRFSFFQIGMALAVILVVGFGFLLQQKRSQVLGAQASVQTPSCRWWEIICRFNNLFFSQDSVLHWPVNNQSNENIGDRITSVLQNIRINGYNYTSTGKSGLLINWRYGTNPLLANGGKCQISNGSNSCNNPGHDRLTDIRYLHNLLSWKSTNPADRQFDDDITRYTQVVKREFVSGTDERGFIYNEWMDMYSLTNDLWYKQAAQNWASAIDGPYYFHRSIGALYKGGNKGGQYRSSDVVSEASSLIRAGKYFGNLQWVQDGQEAIQFVVTHAYITQYYTFMGVMDKILNADGTVNPNESIYHGQSNHAYAINGNTVKAAGELGDAVYALLLAYQVDPTYTLLVNGKSETMLQFSEEIIGTNLLPSSNALGVWDAANEGYFFGVRFSGTSFDSPGVPTLDSSVKESGRQFVILKLFHLVNQLDHNKYQDMEQRMTRIAINKAYYTDGHGFLYAMTPNWQPTTQKNGQLGNYVTTEAMGIVLEALLQQEEQKPITPVTISSGSEAIHPSIEKIRKVKKQDITQQFVFPTETPQSDIILPDSVDAANQ